MSHALWFSPRSSPRLMPAADLAFGRIPPPSIRTMKRRVFLPLLCSIPALFLCVFANGEEVALPGWARAFKQLNQTTIPEFTLENETGLADALFQLSQTAKKQDAAFSFVIQLTPDSK